MSNFRESSRKWIVLTILLTKSSLVLQLKDRILISIFKMNLGNSFGEYFNGMEKTLVWNSKGVDGGISTYLPHRGEALIVSPSYDAEAVRSPHYGYFFDAFGRPDKITFANAEEVAGEQSNRFSKFAGKALLAETFPPEIAPLVAKLNFEVDTNTYELNDKTFFQNTVADTLGPDFSTRPSVIKEGRTKAWLAHECAEYLATSKSGKAVIRIPDYRIAPGGGMGVKFFSSNDEAIKFLENLNILDDGVLTATILLEDYIENIGSPSATFWLDDNEAHFLSINSQVLDNGKFIAGTNVVPAELKFVESELKEKASELALKMRLMGARGFMGFDTVITPDGKIVFIECNYRETGSTIPFVLSKRVDNFDSESRMNWVYSILLEYNSVADNMEKLMDVLEKMGVLFKGYNNPETDLNKVTVVINYANEGGYDLGFFWDKKMLGEEKAVEQINQIMLSLGHSRQFKI